MHCGLDRQQPIIILHGQPGIDSGEIEFGDAIPLQLIPTFGPALQGHVQLALFQPGYLIAQFQLAADHELFGAVLQFKRSLLHTFDLRLDRTRSGQGSLTICDGGRGLFNTLYLLRRDLDAAFHRPLLVEVTYFNFCIIKEFLVEVELTRHTEFLFRIDKGADRSFTYLVDAKGDVALELQSDSPRPDRETGAADLEW